MNTPTSQAARPAAPAPSSDRLTTTVERILGGIVWATQAAAAAAYLGAAGRPSMWMPGFTNDYRVAICMVAFIVSAITMWAISMFAERTWFYNRPQQRSYRRLGLGCHLGVVVVAALMVSKSPERIGWWAALGIFCFAAVVTWVTWMEVKLLPEEDQAVIDAVLAREAAKRRAVYDASEREKRHARLAAIVSSLGYTLTDPKPAATAPSEPPAVHWTIPAGKHKPLVYFIRNGNRMKIGTTTELKRRIRTLALRGENVALLVDGGQSREHDFHKQFADHRIGNTEWFAYEGALADYVHEQINRVHQEGPGK